MNPKRFAAALLVLSCWMAPLSLARVREKVWSQEEEKKPAKKEAPEPRARDGRKLLTAVDLLKIAGVSGSRISPDGARVAYTVSETRMEKDKEWKTVSQVWVVPIAGGKPVARVGNTLSILHKRNGAWLLVRDANMLAPTPAGS